MSDTPPASAATFPRRVLLEGGPMDGRTVTVGHPALEVYFPSPNVVYRPTDDPNIWRYADDR